MRALELAQESSEKSCTIPWWVTFPPQRTLLDAIQRTCAYNLFPQAERSDMAIELAPSILSANFGRLGEDAKAALEGGGTVLHVDVMDGHFVPNITIGPLVVSSLRKALP